MAQTGYPISAPLYQSTDNAPVDQLTGVGVDVQNTTVQGLIDAAYPRIYNGLKVLDLNTGIRYKIHNHTGNGNVGIAQSVASDWSYYSELESVIKVNDITKSKITNFANCASSFDSTMSIGKLYLVTLQGTNSTTRDLLNGIYVCDAVGSLKKYRQFSSSEGSAPPTDSIAFNQYSLQKTTVFVPYVSGTNAVNTGMYYRCCLGDNTLGCYYVKDDFVSNGAITKADNSLNLSFGGTITSAGNLTVTSGGITITGNSTIGGTLSGISTLSAGVLSISTTASIGQTLTVGGTLTTTGNIISGTATLSLYPTTVTNLTIGAAATTLSLGAETGITTINNFSKSGYEYSSTSGVGIAIDFTKGNVFYFDVTASTTVTITQANLTDYNGGTFLIMFRNSNSSVTDVVFTLNDPEGLFEFDGSSTTTITLASRKMAAYTGIIVPISGTSKMVGIISAASQNLTI